MGVVVLGCFIGAKGALAVDITVNSTAFEAPSIQSGQGVWTNGNCTLGEAIQAAVENRAIDACPAGEAGAPDVIHLQENTTYIVNAPWATGGFTAMPDNSGGGGPLVIEGHGATLQRPADAPPFRFFYSVGSLTIRNLTMTGGNLTSAAEFGGAIYYFGSLTLESCTLRGNTAQMGGAIYSRNIFNASASTLSAFTMSRGTVEGNRAYASGGALYLEGNGTVNDTTFTNNQTTRQDGFGEGGAIWHGNGIPSYVQPNGVTRNAMQAILRINRSFFSQNNASSGGAIYNSGSRRRYDSDPQQLAGQVILTKVSVSNNTSLAAALYNQGQAFVYNSSLIGNTGGAIINSGVRKPVNVGGYLVVLNSTIANNTRGRLGAGILSDDYEVTRIFNSTITGNTTTEDNFDGVYAGSKSVTIQNSILSGNSDNDCGGNWPLGSFGNNIIGSRCRITAGPGDQIGVAPLLQPLVNTDDAVAGNEYFPLGDGSPAINAGNAVFCVNSATTPNLDRDQTSQGRDGVCDIGSAERLSVVHYWSFDQLQNGVFPEYSGSARVGQINGVNPAQALVPGVSSNALQCDGVNDYVQNPNAGLLGIANTWSVSFWVFADSPARNATILTLGKKSADPNLNAKNFTEIRNLGNGKFTIQYLSDDRTYAAVNTVNPVAIEGAWHHVTVTKSDQNNLAAFAFYLDGVSQPLSGGANLYPQVDDGDRFITLCKEIDSSFFAGKIDEFVIRNTVMSADAVLAECRRLAPEGNPCRQ